MTWALTMELMVHNKVLNLKPKRSKSFSIAIKARGCSIYFTLNILNGYFCFYEVRCYWKHLWNLKNMLETHWEHNGNTLWTTKIRKIQEGPPPSPQKKLIWYKNKVLLGTPWVLEKKIGNSLGIQWDHGGNTLRTRKIQCPPFPISPFP